MAERDDATRVVRVTLNQQQMELVRALVEREGHADPAAALLHGLRESARAHERTTA